LPSKEGDNDKKKERLNPIRRSIGASSGTAIAAYQKILAAHHFQLRQQIAKTSR